MEREDEFGARLRRLREAAGLTQEELAARAGLSPTAISALERGARRRPYPHTIGALADALGLAGEERAALADAAPRRVGMAFTPPATPARPTHAPLSPLSPPTPLIGRDREVAAIAALLGGEAARLVTLTGPGGVGKTRLALAAAAAAADAFPDGVAVVALAPLADPALVVSAIADALGLREAGGQATRRALHAFLQPRRLLLVLDNLEHLLAAAPELAALLAAGPRLALLATSRAALRVRGEQEYPVAPLALPALDRLPTAAGVVAAPAAQLFVERARAVAPAFELTQANAAAVAAICRRLDGLPLALELAAARVRLLSPTELLARLDRALPLLAGGARDLPARQRTMRDAIAWSYDLLTPAERALFRRLSVFAGGWTLEAAEAVGGAGNDTDGETLDHLAALVEQSLAQAEAGGAPGVGGSRYRLLEPVRDYAREALEAHGEADEARQRHAAHYVALAEAAAPALRGPEQVAWLGRLEAEHDNLRAALGWLLGRGDAETAARLGWPLWLFWWMRGHFSEGRRWMEAALALAPGASPIGRARALLTVSVLAYGQGDHAAAAPAAAESLALHRGAGDRAGVALATAMVALVAAGLGEHDRAADLMAESVALCRAAGDRWSAAMMLSYSAVVALHRGDRAGAARLAEEGLALSRELGDRIGAYAALYNLAALAQARGDLAGAARLFGEGLALSAEVGDAGNAAYCLEGLAEVAAARGDLARAARLWGAAAVLLERGEPAVYAHTPDRALAAGAVAAARARLDAPAWEAAWGEGRAMTLAQAVELGMASEPPPA